MTRRRRAAIREAIQARPVRTQRELVEILRARGFPATQATVSRDITRLGLSKRGGRYVLPDLPPSPPGPAEIGRERILAVERAGPHLLVVKTGPGEAGVLGLEVDRAAWPEVAGTVAGDDTVFIACRSEKGSRRICRRLHGGTGP
jgi:transcriptional regulator of arginine metabolism